MILAGKAILIATDRLDMRAQGALWVYDHMLDDWRYYIVTSLVDGLGRRKTYDLLLEAFEKAELSEIMTIEDVHLGSPRDPFFNAIGAGVGADGAITKFQNWKFEGGQFDGAIYRAVKKPPSREEAQQIQKSFAKRVRDLVAS